MVYNAIMQTVFIIHGTEGHPEGNWFPWLKIELEALGFRVIVPRFPSPNQPLLKEWLAFFDQYRVFLTPDTIVVGHSLGPAFLLHVLHHFSVGAAFFVAGFIGAMPNEFNDRIKNFTDGPFDWKSIRAHCKNFVVLNSDTDPYVPLAKGEELAHHLGVPLEIVHNAGHFNTAAGYTEFPFLLEKIKKTLLLEKKDL